MLVVVESVLQRAPIYRHLIFIYLPCRAAAEEAFKHLGKLTVLQIPFA